ncbi:ribonuclease E [Aliikangiella maris]|uniref:Ribonuclease E n=2 Tax=Aliikangiella maris TaxID=3162458 RepID=A0ABV2BUM5_9GAMM
MKRMLINATQPEEIRVALVDGQKLFDLDIELVGKEQKKANIYKGKITRIEPSLEAAFVDYGAERHGFLPLKEISREYFTKKNFRGRPNIKDVLNEGQEVIVQIDKEERGSKGAALTTFISLAGCYIVLMPNNPRAGGISRRIEGEEREELRNAMRNIQVPKGMGCIVRTAGVGRNAEELEWDMSVLQNLWSAIQNAAEERPAPFLIHQESDVIIRALRDYLRSDIGEIIVDKREVFDKVKRQILFIRPTFENRIKLNEDREIPLFTRYQIESQIETAYQREVRLPSGGSIVIDPTEALVSIDINSARATKGADIEETALQTNKEAAQEIARQLRLRDMGGLIVIDFIDMSPAKNQREVESVLKDALTRDRARVQVGKISRFGLLEMSRQRLKPSLEESAHNVCPRCSGTGTVRGIESLALSVLRLIEEEATKELTTAVQALLPVKVATFLLNEKRKIIHAIEKRLKVKIYIIPNPYMDTPSYEITRMRGEEKLETATHEVVNKPQLEVYTPTAPTQTETTEQAAVTVNNIGVQPAPVHVKKTESKPGFFSRLWQALFGDKDGQDSKKNQKGRKHNRRNGQRFDKNRSRNNRKGKPRNKQDNKESKDDSTRSPKGEKRSNTKRNQQNQKNQNATSTAVNEQQSKPQRKRKDRPPRQSREERQTVQAKNRQEYLDSDNNSAENNRNQSAKSANQNKQQNDNTRNQSTSSEQANNQSKTIQPKTVADYVGTKNAEANQQSNNQSSNSSKEATQQAVITQQTDSAQVNTRQSSSGQANEKSIQRVDTDSDLNNGANKAENKVHSQQHGSQQSNSQQSHSSIKEDKTPSTHDENTNKPQQKSQQETTAATHSVKESSPEQATEKAKEQVAYAAPAKPEPAEPEATEAKAATASQTDIEKAVDQTAEIVTDKLTVHAATSQAEAVTTKETVQKTETPANFAAKSSDDNVMFNKAAEKSVTNEHDQPAEQVVTQTESVNHDSVSSSENNADNTSALTQQTESELKDSIASTSSGLGSVSVSVSVSNISESVSSERANGQAPSTVQPAACRSYAPATKPQFSEMLPTTDFNFEKPSFEPGILVTRNVEEQTSINKSYSPMAKPAPVE